MSTLYDDYCDSLFTINRKWWYSITDILKFYSLWTTFTVIYSRKLRDISQLSNYLFICTFRFV